MTDTANIEEPVKEVSTELNFKNLDYLQRFMSPQGSLHSRKRTGFNARQQRKLKRAVKYARFLALLPFVNR
jgi:small subunit ribosomal protein S18